MSLQPESNRGEVVYRIDPFSIIFRELDLLHSEIRELKSEISFLHKRIDETNNRIDEMNIRIDETNKRIDELARNINRRLDKLYLVVIINLVAILGFFVKDYFEWVNKVTSVFSLKFFSNLWLCPCVLSEAPSFALPW
jgi:hypothetical protein